MNIDNYPLDFKHLYVSRYVGAFFMVNRLKGYKVENVNWVCLSKTISCKDNTIHYCSLSERAGNNTEKSFTKAI